MFEVGQKVYCVVNGWGKITATNKVYASIVFDHERRVHSVYQDGRYKSSQQQAVFHSKPIIAGFEPLPFEPKMKEGDRVVARARIGCFEQQITIKYDNKDEVVTKLNNIFLKCNYTFHPVGEAIY